MHYVIAIDTDTRPVTADLVDQVMEDLEPWHVAAAESPRRTLRITVTLPAESLAQAIATALRVAAGHGEAVAVLGSREDDRDASLGFAPVSELVSVSQAAERLGVSRQRILQMVDEGKLVATQVGTAWVITAASLPERGSGLAALGDPR